MPRIRGVQQAQARAAKDEARAVKRGDSKRARTAQQAADSYQNFALSLGMGTDNALASSSYGFNPITRNRTLLEWMYRGSWLPGVAVDVIADDMTRAGIDMLSSLPPDQTEQLQQESTNLGVWKSINAGIKWGRLYGGAIVVYLIDGHDMKQPLRLDKIGKGAFKGLLVLDRWMVEPTLDQANIVQELGPNLGQPMYYKVNNAAPALYGKVIHYSRVMRFDGVELPYWQRVMENLWGISVLERLYDRIVAFDSATTGAAQLVYKSFIRTYKIKDLRLLLATGGNATRVLTSFVEMMRRFQGLEGITMIDADDDMVVSQSSVQSGIAEALVQFGQQLSGALGIPLVRLFGQSPAGLNSTGESDLVTYYDMIKQKQENQLRVGVATVYKLMGASKGIRIDDKFNFNFAPLWQLSEEKAAQVDQQDTQSVALIEERGLISPRDALKELRQRGRPINRWTNITDEMIEAADDEVAPSPEELGVLPGGDPGEENDPAIPAKTAGISAKKAQDSYRAYRTTNKRGRKWMDTAPITEIMGRQIIIETAAGTARWNGAPAISADYGYLRRVPSAEGPEEWMDCFVGPDRNSDTVFVCHQMVDGKFAEHKVMFGFENPKQAKEAFESAYGWMPQVTCGKVIAFCKEELDLWLVDGNITEPITRDNMIKKGSPEYAAKYAKMKAAEARAEYALNAPQRYYARTHPNHPDPSNPPEPEEKK